MTHSDPISELPATAILYEDHHCLVVNKPAGLPTQAPSAFPALEHLVRAYIKRKYAKPGNVYLGIPQRLDRPVSGVIVFARNTKAAQSLHAQFAERRTEKTYWALTAKVIEPEAGEWFDYLRKIPDQARGEITTADTVGAKDAWTLYRRLAVLAFGSLLELTPKTGRMHQLRLQAAGRGCPILGDELYGSSTPFGPSESSGRERLIALHARRLTFVHPVRRRPVTVEAPLPEVWRAYLPQVFLDGADPLPESLATPSTG